VSIALEDVHYAAETKGHATVVVAPMTVGMADAAAVISRAIHTVDAERPLIVYGEDVGTGDMASDAVEIAGSGQAAWWKIISTLERGGVFCTYPDFVYKGHASIMVNLLGRERPLASGFLSVASRPSTMLLPCIIRRENHALTCRFYEPVLAEHDAELSLADPGAARKWRTLTTAQLVARMLEALILQAGHQWLLLPTLTYDAPQMMEA
jgi:hypothetical protein